MRVHYLQHVPFEGLSSIEGFLKDKGHTLSATKLYRGQSFPSVQNIDWLIVMGGPMGIDDLDTSPWLAEEKSFIKEVIESGRIVLGICLGAQLIADVLGAKVRNSNSREIGWFNIKHTSDMHETILANAIPNEIEVFHWHGDTFDIPEGAKSLLESEACNNQGFILNNRVVGLQFHLETTYESAEALIDNCRDDLDGSIYVQSEEEILCESTRFSSINQVMLSVLDALEGENT